MNNLIKKYFTLTNTTKRRSVLDSIQNHRQISFEDSRILDYLWYLRYGPETNSAIVKDAFLNAFLKILSLDVDILSDNQWKLSQQQLFQSGCILGLEDYQFQTPRGKQLFVLEYANFTGFYMQFGKKEELYNAASRIPERFGLYKIFSPFRSGINSFFSSGTQNP